MTKRSIEAMAVELRGRLNDEVSAISKTLVPYFMEAMREGDNAKAQATCALFENFLSNLAMTIGSSVALNFRQEQEAMVMSLVGNTILCIRKTLAMSKAGALPPGQEIYRTFNPDGTEAQFDFREHMESPKQ
jgi:hypothetical protein